tara:strand:- start:392 stop:658 length:267 start_codon:yes stop_codon:yes gene_type:complete
MITLRLPEMVEKVSSLAKNQSVKSTINENHVSISTEVWDFNFVKLKNMGCYVYDSTVIINEEGDLINLDLKKTLMREVIGRFGLTISL